MIFSEIYGTYYLILEELLARAAEGGLTRSELEAVIRSRGFGESILTIPEKLADGSWPLLTPELQTPLHGKPDRPLTTLEKRWMKALLQDPRIRLFDPPEAGLEEVQPLYPPGAIVYFDRYGDGDPYEDPAYIANFRTILRALREKRRLHLRFEDRNGVPPPLGLRAPAAGILGQGRQIPPHHRQQPHGPVGECGPDHRLRMPGGLQLAAAEGHAAADPGAGAL